MARYLRTMVAALAATTAVAAEASAEWTPPVGVSAPTGVAERPQVAVDPAGTATVVWTRYEGSDVAVHARRIAAGGALGPILDVSQGEEALNAEVAVDAAGNAWVAWTGHEGDDAVARARRISAAGVLGDVLTLSAPDEIGFSPVVGVDGDGDAAVVWTRYENPDFRIQARRISAAGVLGPIDDVTPDATSNHDYDLAVDPSGDAVVVWPWRAGSDTVIQWRRLGGPIQDLSAAGSSSFAPRVAIDGAGVATAVWYRDDGTVQARRSAAGGTLLPIVDLSTTEAVEPEVAIDARGDATVVWERWDGVTDRIELRRYAADGTLEPVRDLWTGGDDVNPRVAVDGSGNATAIWLHTDGSDTVVRSRTAAPGGALGPSLDLTAVGDDVSTPEIAGGTIAVWARVDDPHTVIEAARVAPAAAALTAAPATPAATAKACPEVTVEKVRPHRRRSRAKGVGARLTLSGDADLRLISAKLAYKLRGRKRTARLRTPAVRGGDEQAKLRLGLPRRLARRLEVGTRVTLVLKLRARAALSGCTFGGAKTIRLRTTVTR